MVLVYVRKTDQGLVPVEIKEVDPNYVPQTAFERFYAFFEDVPLIGGREWETLSVADITTIFNEAAIEVGDLFRQHYDVAVASHAGKSYPERIWEEQCGWVPPPNPTQAEIIQAIAARCYSLADWMEANASRPFFADSDMSYLIETPRAVAARLAA